MKTNSSKDKKSSREQFESLMEKVIDEAFSNENIVFKKSSYSVEVLNSKGDTNISHNVHIVNTGIQPRKEYETVVVASSEMKTNNMKLSSHTRNRPLKFEVFPDKPNEKHLTVFFDRPLEFMEELDLTIEYYWAKMMPDIKEHYLIYFLRPCHELVFKLNYYKPIDDIGFNVYKISKITSEQEKLPNLNICETIDNNVTVRLLPDLLFQYKFEWISKTGNLK